MGKNQHVVPAGDKWGIKGEGNSRLTSTFDRQSDAIAAARQISKNQHSEGCGRVKMCHGEIRCGFFFLVESDITIFLPSTIGFFCFQPLFNKVKKVKSSHFSFSVELTSPLFCRLRSKSLI